MSSRKPLVAANWKMNGSLNANATWCRTSSRAAGSLACDVVVCPPFPYLAPLAGALADSAELGAQDLSEREAGAFTGDVAAAMLTDVGCRWVIVGHSERRQWHSETDALVAAKAERALAGGLRPIVCLGETLDERDAGRTEQVVRAQLAAVIDRIGAAGLARGALAYEPVWAIGTGRNATPDEAQRCMPRCVGRSPPAIRARGTRLRILYGGSVKPGNAAELFAQPDIDGGLIGGASLKRKNLLRSARQPASSKHGRNCDGLVDQLADRRAGLFGDLHHRAGAAATRQRRRHGRCVRRRSLGQSVRRYRVGELPVAHDGRRRDAVLRRHAGAGLYRQRNQAAGDGRGGVMGTMPPGEGTARYSVLWLARRRCSAVPRRPRRQPILRYPPKALQPAKSGEVPK
jgi:triosephosphate isomerase (TIM)